MDATCAVCGTTFPARSARARYCSDRCRKRKDKAAEVVELTASAQPDEPTDRLGPVTLMTIKELQEAGRFETALGQACIALAHRMDRPGLDTGSALAAVAARLDDLLAKATKGTGARSAPQTLRDELAARRAKHA